MKAEGQKKILITGAKGSLGAAVVSRFLSANFQVIGTVLPSDSLEKSTDSCRWLPLDITDPKSVKKELMDLEIDALIHCAGGFRFAKADQVSDADLDFLINTNLKSAFYLVREILPGMKKRNFGRIAFISSRATLQTSAGMSAYVASKAGLNLLTSTLAEEVKPFNITVNAILPTVIDTPPNRRDMPNANFSDWVQPDQLAEILFSLVSPWGNAINGALLPVSGRL